MVMSARVTDALTCIPPRKIRARLLGGKHTSLKFLVEVSLLKNSFALSPAPGSGAEYAVFVAFWPCFRILDRRPDRRLLFQHAGVSLQHHLTLTCSVIPILSAFRPTSSVFRTLGLLDTGMTGSVRHVVPHK